MCYTNTPTDIKVKLGFYSTVADALGRRAEQRMLSAGATLGDLLAGLAAQYPALSEFMGASKVQTVPASLRVLRNGRAVLRLDEPLADGDKVHLFPVISGG